MLGAGKDWNGKPIEVVYVHLCVCKRESVRSYDWGAGSVSDFRGLLKGLPLLAIKTQVMEKSP